MQFSGSFPNITRNITAKLKITNYFASFLRYFYFFYAKKPSIL
ncbi:hypothetical protein NIASO_03570 [Niabella soli DSM 19437]|uniref:Uncharacterized protein n=1 Tax=Niabella soli DSM 19437 TaxID=929713 RepID=W0F5W6_9BACT|nr:hypothetical protein NIASO_03570 [Niabella soli DSM 19437]